MMKSMGGVCTGKLDENKLPKTMVPGKNQMRVGCEHQKGKTTVDADGCGWVLPADDYDGWGSEYFLLEHA